MDRNEAIDILRVIAPPRTSKKAFYDFMEARDMAIAALEAYVPDMNVGRMEPMDVSKTEQADGWMERNKDKILQAGLEGREVEFRIGGRLFAIREKAQ